MAIYLPLVVLRAHQILNCQLDSARGGSAAVGQFGQLGRARDLTWRRWRLQTLAEFWISRPKISKKGVDIVTYEYNDEKSNH